MSSCHCVESLERLSPLIQAAVLEESSTDFTNKAEDDGTEDIQPSASRMRGQQEKRHLQRNDETAKLKQKSTLQQWQDMQCKSSSLMVILS
jgi:hypothetical protein